jgi:hypothetical protein
MRNSLHFFAIALFLIQLSCNQAAKQDDRPYRLASNGDTIYQVFDNNGTLLAEETVKSGQKNGPAWTYYPGGNIKQKIMYKDGEKHGIAEWYYDDGTLYQATPYENGLINGVRKKYYDNGQLEAEIPYQKGQPFPGTREYDRDGNILQDTTRLLFYPENDVDTEGKFRLRLYFSDKSRDVFYYYFKEVDGEFVKIGIPAAYNGIGDYIIEGIPKTPVPKEIRFYAEKKSQKGNPIVLSDVYDFETAIKNGEGKDYPKGIRRVY